MSAQAIPLHQAIAALHDLRCMPFCDLVAVTVVLLPLLGRDLDTVVDPEQGRGRLERTLQRLDLAHGGLEDAGVAVVDHLAVE